MSTICNKAITFEESDLQITKDKIFDAKFWLLEEDIDEYHNKKKLRVGSVVLNEIIVKKLGLQCQFEKERSSKIKRIYSQSQTIGELAGIEFKELVIIFGQDLVKTYLLTMPFLTFFDMC